MFAKLRHSYDKRWGKSALAVALPSALQEHVERELTFLLVEAGSASSNGSTYPALNQSERFCDPHAPLPSDSAVAEPVLSPEEQDALFARRMEEQEKKDRAEREARDEKIARELNVKEQARYEREQAEAERLARELEAELFDSDLRQENGILECPLCLGEFYKGE